MGLLAVQDRLVESSALKKAIETVYSAYLPKNTHPFLYMSLEIAPHNVDVNVHPTKHEVHFLHEDAIIEAIQRVVETRLLGSNVSRTYFTQALLPGQSLSVPELPHENKKVAPSSEDKEKLYAHQMVRTDSKTQKLDSFLQKTPVEGSSPQPSTSAETPSVKGDERLLTESPDGSKAQAERSTSRKRARSDDTLDKSSPQRREVRLTSVINMKEEIEEKAHSGLRELLRDHTFVGIVSPEHALIQHQTKLYLANTTKLSRELFYQIMVHDFSNFGLLRLSEPAPLYDLAMLALNMEESGWTENDGPKPDLAQYIVDFLSSKSEMLTDYFSVEVNEKGELCTLPLLMDKYIPALEGLPLYVLRLATEVEWDSEQECFESFCRETAEFYAMKKDWIFSKPSENQEGSSTKSSDSEERGWKWSVEHAIYPSIKATLLPPRSFSENASLLQIASLPDLYKVFERC